MKENAGQIFYFNFVPYLALQENSVPEIKSWGPSSNPGSPSPMGHLLVLDVSI